MATYVDSVAEVFAFEAANGTTAAFTQGTSNRILIGGSGWGNFGTTPTITLKYGGSGGTDITPGDAATAFLFGNCVLTAGPVLPGPTGTTTIYASAGNLQGSAAGVAYDGVEDYDDWTPNSGVAGDINTTVASVTVPNCVAGQTVVAIVGAGSINLTLGAFTAVSGTTIRAMDVGGDLPFMAICVLEKVASSDGDCVLSVNCNSTNPLPEDTIGWAAKGLRLIDAGGGASHDTSGALAAQSASIAGTAAFEDQHATTGSLVAGSATISGAAERQRVHGTSGALAAQSASIAGTAAFEDQHATSGALAAQAASLAGSAEHTAPGEHISEGELVASPATISGVADRTHLHGTNGVLAGQAASLAGSAQHNVLHGTSGTLVAGSATLTGEASRTEAGVHTAAGDLEADPATISGVAELVTRNSPLDAKYLAGKRKNVPFKPLKEPASDFVPNVIDPPTAKKARKQIDLSLLPEPVAAPAPAPKKSVAAPTPKPAPLPVPPPAPEPAAPVPREAAPPPPPAPPAPPAATQEQVAGLSTAVAEVTLLAKGLAEANALLVEQLQGVAGQLAKANEAIAKLHEDARIRDQKARNERRAREIADKLLRD